MAHNVVDYQKNTECFNICFSVWVTFDLQGIIISIVSGTTTTRPGLFQNQMMPGQQQTSSMIGGAAGSSIQHQQSSSSSSGVVNSGVPGVFPDVDMSHLSEEERMLIESVMAKAQMEELELEQSVVSKPQVNSRYSPHHSFSKWKFQEKTFPSNNNPSGTGDPAGSKTLLFIIVFFVWVYWDSYKVKLCSIEKKETFLSFSDWNEMEI